VYDFQITIVGLTLTGPITKTLVAQQSINMQGISYDSYRITLTGSGSVSGIIAGYTATGSWAISGDDYVRTSDLADIKSHLSFQISLHQLELEFSSSKVMGLSYQIEFRSLTSDSEA
jgi:hypothetical protein